MRSIRLLLGAAGAALLVCCGGGGSAAIEMPPIAIAVPQPVPVAPPVPFAPLVLAFEEAWEPRTAATGVCGVVWTAPLRGTPDGADPQQPWSENGICARWGTLQSHDGSVPGMPSVAGLGGNGFWGVANGQLLFRARPMQAPTGENTGGFALISRQTFPRGKPIAIEANMVITQGTESAFAEMALIAGEGDYRGLAILRQASGDDWITLVAPLYGAHLWSIRRSDGVALRIEYDPIEGFTYLADGRVIGRERLDHLGASFATDPGVGLYFTGAASVPGAFVEGVVGPVRVWTSKEAGNA